MVPARTVPEAKNGAQCLRVYRESALVLVEFRQISEKIERFSFDQCRMLVWRLMFEIRGSGRTRQWSVIRSLNYKLNYL